MPENRRSELTRRKNELVCQVEDQIRAQQMPEPDRVGMLRTLQVVDLLGDILIDIAHPVTDQ